MPWGAAIAAGGALGGAAIGANANSRAARGQQASADAAAQLQRDQYNQTRADNLTRMQIGDTALGRLAGMDSFVPPTAEEVQSEPGYAFGLSEGTKLRENSAAARGGLYSTKAGRDLSKFGTDYASTKYGDTYNRKKLESDTRWNRLAGLAGIGQTAQTQVNSAGGTMANNVGGLLTGNANAQGAAGIANANLWVGALNQLGSSYIDYRRRAPSSVGTSRNTGYDPGGDGGYDQYYADGGPVMLVKTPSGRYEPKVGTRAPVSRGTGGGMSPEAIAAALAATDAPEKSGIATLPADPLRNQRAILEDRMNKAGAGGTYKDGGAVRKDYGHGGKVKGPGGPRSDKIKARLSDGEHVIDARAVTALGRGSNAAGQAKLNEMRSALHRLAGA